MGYGQSYRLNVLFKVSIGLFQLEAKRELRKAGPPSDGGFRCQACGRICRSRIGLFAHIRDDDTRRIDGSNSPSWHPCRTRQEWRTGFNKEDNYMRYAAGSGRMKIYRKRGHSLF